MTSSVGVLVSAASEPGGLSSENPAVFSLDEGDVTALSEIFSFVDVTAADSTRDLRVSETTYSKTKKIHILLKNTNQLYHQMYYSYQAEKKHPMLYINIAVHQDK